MAMGVNCRVAPRAILWENPLANMLVEKYAIRNVMRNYLEHNISKIIISKRHIIDNWDTNQTIGLSEIGCSTILIRLAVESHGLDLDLNSIP